MLKEMKINPDLKDYYREKGYWSDRTLKDCWEETVRKYPDREYVTDDRGYRYTYGEMDEAASRIGAFLLEKGVRPGETVSYQIPVWSEFAIITIACIKIGAVAHPVSLSYEEKELIRGLNLTEPKVFFCPTFFYKTDYEQRILNVLDEIPSVETIVLLENVKKMTSNCPAFHDILENGTLMESRFFTEGSGQNIAAVLSTSGTTSGTKGVLLTHDNIIYSEKTFNKELNITEEDIMFMAAPLHHATGFHHGIIAPMLAGAKVVLQERYRCKTSIELMNREKCTYSMGATPFIYDILKDMEFNGGALPHLKFYLCGGAPVPGYMVQKAWKFGILLCEVYGSTESVPHVYVRPEEALALNGTTSGRAIEGVEIRVVDERGNDVPAGTPGEELSRGPNVFVGYLKDKKTTDSVLDEDGWYHSGDLCVMDEEGNIRIIGRKKDIIVRGGENLNSNEINDHLEGCPGVRDHTVVGIPDDRLGERICAFVVPNKGVESLELDAVLGYLKNKNVPKRFWPERLELIDKIPKTGSGKVKKYLLLDRI
jgi:acyl-CoA synthetase